jgi:cytochrome c-type biogenesis protein CcmH
MQFWSIAVLMVLATTAVLVVPLFWRELAARRATAASGPWRHYWPALALCAAVPLVALGVYAFTGNPVAAARAAPAGGMSDPHTKAAMSGSRDGGDLEDATSRLRTRLEAEPDDAAGWQLLAASYDFLGREAEAADARRRAGTAGRAAGGMEATAGAGAKATTNLSRRAQDLRRRREFKAANAAFAELERTGAMSADLWADYADSLGAERGALDSDAAACIEAALKLDPEHPKALWLLGSRQTQQGEHAAALRTWRRLQGSLPADSPDARFIAANIEESQSRLGGMTTSTIRVHGVVELDPALRGRVPAGAVLYVVARAADQAGPPLAVVRAAPGVWPLRFTLDDSHAMLPDRRLSNFTRVVVEARISTTGDPLPRAGDWRAISPELDPRNAPELHLELEGAPSPDAQGG